MPKGQRKVMNRLIRLACAEAGQATALLNHTSFGLYTSSVPHLLFLDFFILFSSILKQSLILFIFLFKVSSSGICSSGPACLSSSYNLLKLCSQAFFLNSFHYSCPTKLHIFRKCSKNQLPHSHFILTLVFSTSF